MAVEVCAATAAVAATAAAGVDGAVGGAGGAGVAAVAAAPAVSVGPCSGAKPGAVETFAMARVGTLRSSFPAAFGCPRQGLAAPSVRGRIELEPWMVAASGGAGQFLDGLEGFSHVWVIFLFDQNRHSSASFDPSSSFLRPMVKPPWLTGADGKRGSCGVFATRSPHRPNPIGLTVCRVDHIDHAAGTVFISGVDVIDGSAVLDIKPYHPIDSIPTEPSAGQPSACPVPRPTDDGDDVARSPHMTAEVATFASWLPPPKPRSAVQWYGNTLEELRGLVPHCTFYPDARDADESEERLEGAFRTLRAAVEEVLGLDPRTPQSRGKSGSGATATTHRYWALDFDAASVAFRLAGGGPSAEGENAPTATFEVVKVGRRGREGARADKAWLDALRKELEADTSARDG
eukprot:CAMPEP_0203915110 /NCGR_PEP_ID=MMETSP0359-20131031/55949_1 /ASSEMBLY_ACC=CAM_ASM_000338 /TAXON_ID=268821 /ORGANISM="Scrippsiella Hangoei, Strain SHTV-5" /LENGTH=402 /DNA_ID=CAMNT_0050841565 /DNA_START=1 /DNA_END=1206 /DNA_ORIENTATION=-